MDKLEKLYNLYLREGIISNATSFEKWKAADSIKQEKLFELGKSKGLFKTSTVDKFKAAWGDTAIPEVKKKDEGMALPSEDGSLASSETDVISKEDLLQQTVTPSEAPTQRDEFAGTIISQQPPKAFSEPVVQDGVSVSEQVKYDPFIESVNKVVNKELVSTPFFNKLPLVSMFTRPAATEENVIPKMEYYFKDYGFEFEPADVFGDGMTVKAKNGKQMYVNLDQAFGGQKDADNLKQFLLENRELKPYEASDRKIYDEQQIKDAVSALNEQAKEWNNSTVELGKLKAMNEQMSQELLGISQYDIDTNPEIRQKVEMYNQNVAAEKQLLDLVMKKGEEFEGKGILLDRLAGEYYGMKSEQGGMLKGIGAGILGRGPANMASSLVDYGVDVYTYLSKNASLTEDKYKEELIRIAKEDGYLPEDEDFSGLSKEQLIERLGGDTNDLGTAVVDIVAGFMTNLSAYPTQLKGIYKKAKEAEATPFDKVNTKVLDYARKGIKYYNDYGVEGLDYDKAVEGRTINPFSEIAAKVDTEMGAIDAARKSGEIISENMGAPKEWSDLTKEGFWGGAILGLSESIPAMLGGSGAVGNAQRIAQMFALTSSFVEQEMSMNPEFDNISESEKLPIKISIATVGAVLENYGFRNLLKNNSFVANLALRALKKVPKGGTVKTLSDVISQDVESAIARGAARGGLSLLGAGLAEAETGGAQELSSIIIKEIYNETKGKKMFQTPESLGELVEQVAIASAQEAVGGVLLGSPGAIVNAIRGKDVQTLSDRDWKNFEMINEDPTMKEIYVSKLKAEIANPKSDKSLADAKAELESVNKIQGLLNSNKQYIGNLSPEQKKRAVQLLLQKQELENKLKNADSQLSSSDRNLLERVNEELDDLSKASTRIEESMEAEGRTIKDFKGSVVDWIKSLGKSKDIGDVMEGGIEIEMDGTKVIMTESDGGVVLESIETQKGKKGKGKAEAALKKITEKADNDGVKVTLKVVPKDSTVDAKRLQNLYERNGFKMQEDGITMVRDPKVQELTQEQKDIEAFFAEDTDEDVERASDNLSINRANEAEGGKSINRATAISAAKFAAKAISKVAPKVRIILHEAESEYLKYATPPPPGEKTSGGEYNPETKTIHINLSNVQKSTVAHEVFHAVLLNKVKDNDALAKKMSDDMVRVVQRRLPENNKLRLKVEAHAARYEGQLQTEEQIAELVGLLSSKEFGYTQLDSDMKSVIKKFLINLAKKLNIPLPKNWGSDQDVVDLINTLARKTRTGEEITEEDVKLLDVKDEGIDGEQQGTEGEVGTIRISRQQKDSIDAPSVNNDPRPWVRELVEDIDISTLNGRDFITNMYDYTNAGVTELGNGYSIELLGGRNYVPIIMNKTGKKLGDISNLAAFNTKSQAEGFIRNAKKGKADLFAPHSGTLKDSWQFQQHIFEQLVDLVLDKNILTNEELIEIFNVNLRNESAKKLYAERIKSIKEKGYYTKKVDKKEVKVTKKPNKPSNFLSPFKKFRKASGLEINNLNSFKSDPKELVRLLNIENNFSPDLRKNLNQKIAANKKFQKAIGVNNLTEFYNKIIDPLNKGVVGGEIMTFIEFDPTTFEVAKTDPADVDHHPSFGWVVKAKIKKIMQPNKFFKSYDITDTYTKYNKNETVVSRKTDENFVESNVKSSAGAQPKIAKVTTPATRKQIIGENAELSENVRNNYVVANQMEDAKKSAEDIRMATGWERGADGKWRYEIDDINIVGDISPWQDGFNGEGYVVNIGDLVEGDLLNAYPQLKEKVTVIRSLPSSEGFGTFGSLVKTQKGWDLYLSDGLFNGDKEFGKSVLLHEIQHIIQDIEGFAKGGNTNNTFSYEDFMLKSQKLQKKQLQDDIDRLNKQITSDRKSLDDVTLPKEIKIWIQKEIDNAESILKSFTYVKDSIKEGYFSDKEKYDAYKRLAGEVEARNVQTRMNMTPEQRRQTLLRATEDVAREDQIFFESTPATRQQKGIQEARENGEVIETDTELVFFKGMQPKIKNGKPFSVHTIDKGRFVALDKNIALDYKGNKPLKQFKVPKGTTVQVVNVPSDSITKYRKAEEKAINESDAQIVKLITIDARGRSEQYVIKDPALLKTATDVKEPSAKAQEKQTSRARQQKGLINFTEKDAIKYSKIGVNDERTIQAMENIGLSGVKFTDEGVNKKIKESLNELYSKSDSYLLNEDSQEITRLMEFEVETAINDGLPDRTISQLKAQVNDSAARKRFISELKRTQEQTLDQWVSYLKQSDYSDAFKYLMLDAVLTHNYDLKTLKYRKRTNKTSRNISPFDAGTLAMLYASDSKNLLKSYVEMQQENLDNIINSSQVKSTEKGKWLKFEGGPNAENINETATALSQLVQDTYWCTKTNALSQLRGGDFYVYVTDKTPRIAIRMEGNSVGEVRGNASSKQDLEPEMLPVAETFLKKNIPNNSGQKWLDSIAFNKKAKEFLERISKGIGEKEIMEFASIVSEGKKYNTDYGKNGFVERIENIFKDKNYYNEDILDRVAFNVDEFDPDKTEYLIGDANFGGSQITDLGQLKIITGSVDFALSMLESLGQLQSIGGNTYFAYSQITDLGQLQSIGGDANFRGSQIKSLGQLKIIGGSADFSLSQIKSLGQLQSIGGIVDFEGSQVTDLGQLQSIGGYAKFGDSQIKSLGQLQSIGRYAKFGDSQVTDLGQLQSIGGDAEFGDSQVKNLGQLQSIGGDAEFGDSQIKSLGQLQSIGRSAFFGDSQVTDLGQLQSIGGNAYFEGSQVTDLGQLQSIGRSAYFRGSEVTDLGQLQSIGGIVDFEGSQVTDLGQLQSIGRSAYFDSTQDELRNEWESRKNKPAIRQQRGISDYINEARQDNFKDSVIRDFLVRVKGFSAKKVDELMSLNVSLLEKMPKSFGNVKGGAKVGIKLYEKVERFRIQEQKRNSKRKNKLTEQEIIDKTIEFLEKQPEYINEGDTYTVGSKKKGTQKTLFRAGISSQQAKMLSDIQKTIGIRPTQNMGVKIAKARLALRERKKGAIDLQKIKTEVRNFIRKALPSELYEKKEVLDLINKVNEANEGNVENIISEIEAFVIETNNKSLQKKIEGILNGKYQTVEGGRRKPKKITDEIRKRIEFIKSNLVSPESTPEEIGEANTKLLERFNEIQEQNFITPEQREEQADIQVAMQYNNALLMENSNASKVTELDGIYSTLENLIKHGRSLLQEELRKSHEAYNKTFELGYEAITGEKVDMNDPDSKRQLNNRKKERFSDEKRKKATQGVIRGFISNIGSFLKAPFGSAEALNGLMDRLDKLPGELFGGRLNEMFTERVDESSRRFKMRMMQIESVIANYLSETYGKKWKQISRQNRMQVDHNIELHDGIMLQPLSQDEIAYLYNMYKDPANRASFANAAMWGSEVIEKDDSAAEKKTKQELNEANAARIMKELEAKLDPKVKEFADWQVDVLYPALYEEYNKTYKKLYRTDLPWNKFYAGTIYRDGFSEDDIEVMNLLGRGNMYKTAVGANATKVRQGSNLPIKPMNMVDVLNTYVNDMEYFAAYGETIRDMDKFFSNKYVKSAIIDIHGQEVYTFVDDMIKKIASRGMQKSGFKAKTINTLNDVFILSRLAISPVIAIKQLTSTFTYANDIGYVNWIKYAAKNKTQQLKVWKEISDNSVYIQDRYKNSITKAIETYSDTKMKAFLPKTSFQQGKNWFIDFAMYTTKLGDKGAIYLGGSPNYSYYKDQALKQGKSEKEAIDIAIRKFERDTKRTQQSSDIQDKDYLQTGDPITRALNMFLTTPKQYLRNEIIAVRNLYRAIRGKDYKGTVGQNVRTFVTYHVFMPLLFQYVSMGLPGILRGFRDDDDEDLLRAAIIGNLNGLFILGEVVNTIGDLFTGKPWTGTQSKSLGVLQIANSIARKFNKANNYTDPDKKAEAYLDAYLELSTITGIPAPTIKKFFDNYSKLNTTDNPGELILRLLNYSEYQISGPPSKNKSKIKTVQEMNEEYQKEKEKKEKEDQKDRIGFYD